MKEMPLEKQFSHTKFCQQIQDIDLDSAKQLLADLHLLYLGQQTLFVELAKRETFDNLGFS
jgi:hypothetical protein